MSDNTECKDLSAFGRTDVDNEIAEITEAVLNEPKIPTLSKKLIIEGSTPGHFPGRLYEHFGTKNMPPNTIEEQAAAIIKCVKAGAAAIHSHPRVPEEKRRYETSSGKTEEPDLLVQIFDKVFKEVDFIPINHCFIPKGWQNQGEVDLITPAKELLEIGKGNRYIQASIVIAAPGPVTRKGLLSSWFTTGALKDAITFLEENHVKPWVALTAEKLEWFKASILDEVDMQTPPHINLQEGKHGANNIFADPMSFISVINNIEMIKKTLPGCTFGIHAGGRNWLPVTVMGIMLGVDVVRVGIEDQFWTYPHKDEYIKSPWEAVEKVALIAKSLGRDLATPDEARKIMGMKQTWKK